MHEDLLTSNINKTPDSYFEDLTNGDIELESTKEAKQRLQVLVTPLFKNIPSISHDAQENIKENKNK